jgi:hypothetical protein
MACHAACKVCAHRSTLCLTTGSTPVFCSRLSLRIAGLKDFDAESAWSQPCGCTALAHAQRDSVVLRRRRLPVADERSACEPCSGAPGVSARLATNPSSPEPVLRGLERTRVAGDLLAGCWASGQMSRGSRPWRHHFPAPGLPPSCRGLARRLNELTPMAVSRFVPCIPRHRFLVPRSRIDDDAPDRPWSDAPRGALRTVVVCALWQPSGWRSPLVPLRTCLRQRGLGPARRRGDGPCSLEWATEEWSGKWPLLPSIEVWMSGLLLRLTRNCLVSTSLM